MGGESMVIARGECGGWKSPRRAKKPAARFVLNRVAGVLSQTRLTPNRHPTSGRRLLTYEPQLQPLRRPQPQVGAGQQTCTGTCLQTTRGTHLVTSYGTFVQVVWGTLMVLV